MAAAINAKVLSLRSTVDGSVWPAIPNQAGSVMLSVLFQLGQSEWWPAQVLWETQRRQIREVLQHAVQNVPFYRQRLGQAYASLPEAFAREDFARLPMLTRNAVQDNFAALRSEKIPEAHGRVSEGLTSGSVGDPLRFLATDLTNFFWHAYTLRDHLWHRRDFRETMLAVREGEKQRREPNWFGSFGQSILDTGPLVAVPLSASLDEVISQISEHKPAYVLGHASQLIALAEETRRRDIRFPGLKQVRTFAEMLPHGAREFIGETWGAPVVDMYTTRECGYLALQCPQQEHFHVQEGVIVEILRDDGSRCEVGETGLVVVTTLHNFAMPLIRYVVGDYAEVGPPCSCGRGLPVLKQVNGRVRNMLLLPSGKKVWPILGFYRDTLPVRQRQVIQKSLEEVELRLVVQRPLTGPEEEQARATLRATLGHPFRVTISYHDEIPRSRGGKFEEFRCEVTD